MVEYKCVIKGCNSTVKVDGSVSPNFKYICSGRMAYGDQVLLHTREQQCRATGRIYNPKADEADKEVHFQDTQFDKDLRRSFKAEGTDHIANQGSDVTTAKEIEKLYPKETHGE